LGLNRLAHRRREARARLLGLPLRRSKEFDGSGKIANASSDLEPASTEADRLRRQFGSLGQGLLGTLVVAGWSYTLLLLLLLLSLRVLSLVVAIAWAEHRRYGGLLMISLPFQCFCLPVQLVRIGQQPLAVGVEAQ
jgi:hypothetical protein